MEKNTSNQYIIRIEKALETRNVSELRNNLYDLHVDNSLSDFEFFDVIGDIYQRAPVFFMSSIYPRMRHKFSRFRKIFGNEGLQVMDKYILEKFGLDKEEKILIEFKGKISKKVPKKYTFKVFKGSIYVTNHRIIAHGIGFFQISDTIGNSFKSPKKAFDAYLSEFKPCYGFSFPIKNLYNLIPLPGSKNRMLRYFILQKRKITINASKNRDTRDKLLSILNEFQTRE